MLNRYLKLDELKNVAYACAWKLQDAKTRIDVDDAMEPASELSSDLYNTAIELLKLHGMIQSAEFLAQERKQNLGGN